MKKKNQSRKFNETNKSIQNKTKQNKNELKSDSERRLTP